MAYAGDVSADWELRKKVVRRVQGMASSRSTFDQHWGEIAKYAAPRISRFLQTGRGNSQIPTTGVVAKGDAVNSRLLDSRGIFAADVLGNGMHSGLCSPARPWFKITTSDPDLKEFKPVKEWLAVVASRIYLLLAKTNFYEATKAGFHDLGLFGTEAAFFEEHWKHVGVIHQLALGEFYIALDDAMVPSTLARRTDFTTDQLLMKFGADQVPKKVLDAYRQNDLDGLWVCWHMVEPNVDRVKGLRDQRNKPFRSLYWMESADAGDPPFLAVEGYADIPFWAPRWDTTGSGVYADRCPGMGALPDLRQLQLAALRKQEGIDLSMWPPLIGPTIHGKVGGASLRPKSYNAVADMGSTQGAKSMWDVNPGALQQVREDIADTRESVDRHFYVPLFQAITNMNGIQPRNEMEIAKRNEEQLSQLGPVVLRSNNEKLRRAVDRAFYILLRNNLVPPPPEAVHGKNLEIEFTSVLAEMQRMVGIGSIERVVGFAGNLIAAFPSIGDKLDVDQAMDEYADMAGSPPSLIRSDDEVAAIRQGRAQQEKMAQMAQMAPALAQGADAAKLLSETKIGDQSGLDRVMGVGAV